MRRRSPLPLLVVIALAAAANKEAPADAGRLEVPAGTVFTVELVDGLSSGKNKAGDAFRSKLEDGVWLKGRVAVPPGTTLRGTVTQAVASGRIKGIAKLSLTLSALELEGKSYEVKTDSLTYTGEGHKAKHFGSGLMGALQGALYGMIFGGRDGAVIGAGAGAAANAAGSIFSGKEDVSFAQGAKLMFELKESVRVPEPPAAAASPTPAPKAEEMPATKPEEKKEEKAAKPAS